MYELIITNENLGPKEDAGLNQAQYSAQYSYYYYEAHADFVKLSR